MNPRQGKGTTKQIQTGAIMKLKNGPPIHLIETKSWSTSLWASSYPFFALSVTGVTLGSGWIVDRFSTVHLLRFF